MNKTSLDFIKPRVSKLKQQIIEEVLEKKRK
jgi:hypothetical protein